MCLHKVPRHLKVCRLLKGIGIIMIRFIFVVLFVVLFLILSTPLMLVEWIIGKFNPCLKDRSSLAIVNWAFRWVIRLSGTKVIAIGEENIPTASFFDVVLTYVRVPRPTGYIAKKEMLKWPLLNIWMKDLHCLFLDRQDIKAGLKTILQAIEKAKNGISICIFPEGTREKEGKPFAEVQPDINGGEVRKMFFENADVENCGVICCGQTSGLIHDVLPVQTIIGQMMHECEATIAKFA